MKHLSSTSWLLAVLVMLCGCGGGSGGISTPLSSPPSSPPPAQAAQQVDVTGNWQFKTTSTTGLPPAMIVGSIIQAESTVSSAVRVDGWNCFDPQTTIDLTGTLTDGNISLTSTSVNGQVITFAGKINKKNGFPNMLAGTYAIDGGCSSGEHGDVTGVNVYALTGSWNGTFTTGSGDQIDINVTMTQGSATSVGSFDLTGTASFGSGSCFQKGTILSGTFPSGSYVMGRAVALEIETDNGVITFLATAEEDGLIRGSYTVAGGTCEPTGTGYLSPWDY